MMLNLYHRRIFDRARSDLAVELDKYRWPSQPVTIPMTKYRIALNILIPSVVRAVNRTKNMLDSGRHIDDYGETLTAM